MASRIGASTPGPCLKRAADRFIQRALEGGINFDTANSYSDGSARRLSVARYAIRPLRRSGGGHEGISPGRGSAGGLSRAQILRSIDDSLRRLGMEYVDLLQIHRWDYSTPIEETLEALNEVVKAGKARYIGAHQCTPASLRRRYSFRRATAGRALSPCRIITT
ncbi:hypothetical protein DMH17_04815 [Raoultella planticola]|nr:hypothetical protein [Raoultella planticola]